MKVLMNSPLSILSGSTAISDEFKFFTQANIEKLESKFEVVWNTTDRQFTKDELVERASDVDAIFTCWQSPRIDADVVAAAKKLKLMIHICGTVKLYVSEALYDSGIKVISANDRYFSESVAEGTLLYILASLRRLDKQVRLLSADRADGWYKVSDARGILYRTIGIVGFGGVGEHMARLLQPFHCKLKVFDTAELDASVCAKYNIKCVSMEELFSTCDVISLHIPHNEQTNHVISGELLSSIKDGALFVNTSRGGVVDEAALVKELESGRFSAALDVFEVEPLASESPLYDLENVLIMPHNAGPSPDLYPHIASNLIDEAYGFLAQGKPLTSEIPKKRAFVMSYY